MERLKQLRTNLGLTQLDVSRLLGVERSTYVKYERGNSDPPTATLVRLADYFAVSVDYLIGHDSDQISRSAPKISDVGSIAEFYGEQQPTFSLSADEMRLLVAYRELNQQGKEYILQSLDMAEKVYKKSDSVSSLEEQIG